MIPQPPEPEDSSSPEHDDAPQSNSQASDQLFVTCVTRRPRAIVVILGNMGCTQAQVTRSSTVYHNMNCSTIAATASIWALATNDTTTIGELAITICREAARLVRMAEMSEMNLGSIPILMHIMGNGGAQVVEELERRIREVISAEDLESFKDDQSISICPLPLRANSSSMRKHASSRSLVSTVLDLSDSEDERSDNDKAPRKGRKGSFKRKPLQRTSSISSLSSRFSLGRSDSISNVVPTSSRRRRRRRKRRSPAVERIDMERTGLPSSLTCPRYNSDDRAYLRDMELFAARLAVGGILWDSAPCYPTLEAELGAASRGIQSTSSRAIAQAAIMSTHGMHGLFRLSWIGNQYPLTDSGITVPGGRAEQFWENLLYLSLTKRHFFVYSTSDPVCDLDKLDDLMQWQQTHGIHVKRLELSSSIHLDAKRHLLDEYLTFTEQAVDNIAGRKLGEDEEEWWSSDEEEAGQEVVEDV